MKGGSSKAESKKADGKLSVKKDAVGGGKPAAKKGRPAKHPKKPERPLSEYFIFMEEFWKKYKENHSEIKSFLSVGKIGAEKWKSMSEAMKAPYFAEAQKTMAEYEKSLQAYNKKINYGNGEVNDDEDDDDVISADDDEAFFSRFR